MKIASSQRSVAASAANRQPSNREKGQRKIKFVPPPVTSINWNAIDQPFLNGLAASKAGEDKVRSLSTDAVNKIAFGCYSAKDLCFILQGMGFSDTPFPTKKNELIKSILSIRLDESHLMHSRNNDDVKLSSKGESQSSRKSSREVVTTPSSASASASFVSVSPQRRILRNDIGSATKDDKKEIIDVDVDANR